MKVVPFCGEEGRDNVLGDTSYFLQTPKPAKRGESINIYAWEIDYYGIPMVFMPRVWFGGGHAKLYSEIHPYCDWPAC